MSVALGVHNLPSFNTTVDIGLIQYIDPAGWRRLRCSKSKPVEPEPASTGVGTGLWSVPRPIPPMIPPLYTS